MVHFVCGIYVCVCVCVLFIRVLTGETDQVQLVGRAVRASAFRGWTKTESRVPTYP